MPPAGKTLTLPVGMRSRALVCKARSSGGTRSTTSSPPARISRSTVLGSGTTLIAAETTGRVCLAVELSPFYADVAVRRWQAFMSAEATLLADGRAFDTIAEERVASILVDKPAAEPSFPGAKSQS
jgi:hypothetical protein